MTTTATNAAAVELPRPSTGLSGRRRVAGLVLVVAGLPLCTAVLSTLRPTLSLPSDLLLYLLAVVLIAVVGGMLPGVLAAIGASLLANYWFTPPLYSFTIRQRDHLLALVVFLVVAVTVSVTVDLAATRRSQAVRSSAEAATLSRLAGSPSQEYRSLARVLEQVRATFAMRSVALLRPSASGGWTVIEAVGTPRRWSDGSGEIVQEADGDLRLVGSGPAVFAEDRRLLAAYAAAAARVLETRQLAEQAARARELAAVDRLRAALLAAVGHDLRTPLSGIKAAVSSLRQHDVRWTEEESAELLATIEESADQLDDLVGNLLDMSRLRAGVLSVETRPVALDHVVAAVLLRLPGAPIDAVVSDGLPHVQADPGLLERAVANLVANAVRFSPAGCRVRITAVAEADAIRLCVVDHGRGVPPGDREEMFAPFHRLGDRGGSGVGLGLAIARGFTEAMGGRLVPSETPGGGLTMSLVLRTAA